MMKQNLRAIAGWKHGGSKIVDWEPVVLEYKLRKAAGTLAEMQIAAVADAALYMHAGLRMRVVEVSKRFGTQNPWFNDLAQWCTLAPEAQACFSLSSYVPDLLTLSDVRFVAGVRPEIQAQGAGNLIRNRQTRRRPKIIARAGA